MAEMNGTLRCDSPQLRDFAIGRIEAYVTGIAAAHRAKGTLTIVESIPAMANDGAVAARMADIIRGVLGEDAADERDDFMPVSEDFSLITERVPSAYLSIGSGLAEDGYTQAVHHPEVTFDEAMLPLGAAAYAACAMQWLQKQ